MSDRIIRIKDVCKALGDVAPSTVYLWVKSGKLPPPQKIVEGGRAAGWPESVIQAFLEKRHAAAQ